MKFKNQKVTFRKKDGFTDDMKRFVVDEAARFTMDGNEAASASMDEMAERTVRFSSVKNQRAVEEMKQVLSDLVEKKEKRVDKESKKRFACGKDVVFEPETLQKEVKWKRDWAKKEKAKEQKKAAVKTSVAAMFRAKRDFSNDLVSDRSTGDALKDGISGLMKTFVDWIHPMVWGKRLFAKVGLMLAPYVAVFLTVAMTVMMVVLLLFSILKPIGEVGEAIDQFLSVFGDESETFQNTGLSIQEIEKIVENSGADETQKEVIRYALSKVGYPYSQANRTSGSAYDCSSLAYYCWKDADVDISYGTRYPPTAAEGARMLQEHGKALTTMYLQPGDLVYYGGSSNGRYLGIYHVAIYVGDGKCVEALNEEYGVVYQNLRTKNAIMVCRPNKQLKGED